MTTDAGAERPLDVSGLKLPLGAGVKDIGEVAFAQSWQDDLEFRIAETDIELKDFGPLVCRHQADIKHSLNAGGLDQRSDDCFEREVNQRGGVRYSTGEKAPMPPVLGPWLLS